MTKPKELVDHVDNRVGDLGDVTVRRGVDEECQ